MANPNDWTGTTVDSSKIIALMKRIHDLEPGPITPPSIALTDGDGAGNTAYFLNGDGGPVDGIYCYQISPFRFLHSFAYAVDGPFQTGITAVGTKVYYNYSGNVWLQCYDKSGALIWSYILGSDPGDGIGNENVDLTIRGGYLYITDDKIGTDYAYRYSLTDGSYVSSVIHNPYTWVDDDVNTTHKMEQEGIYIGSSPNGNKVYGPWGSTTLPVVSPNYVAGIAVGNAILATGRESGHTDNSFWILNKTSGAIEEYFEGDETFPGAYTTWYAYRPTLNNRVSMGTDPPTNWISTNAWPYRMIIEPYARDLRAALEILAELYEHSGNGNVYNFVSGNSNNLYYVANGDRTKFGATGGAKYTWTHSPAQLDALNEVPDIVLGEIEECIATLEISTPIF